MRFLPVAALVAIVWLNTSNENWNRKTVGHSYITLKPQSLQVIQHFTRFFEGNRRINYVERRSPPWPAMIVLDDLVLEWYTIEQGSVCIGQSIRDLQVRTESGASIVSIIAPNRINRINPEADTILNEGATLIFIGGSIYIVLNFVVGVAYAI